MKPIRLVTSRSRPFMASLLGAIDRGERQRKRERDGEKERERERDKQASAGRGEPMMPPPPHPLPYQPITRQAGVSDLCLVLGQLVTPLEEETDPGTPSHRQPRPPFAGPAHPTWNKTPPHRCVPGCSQIKLFFF